MRTKAKKKTPQQQPPADALLWTSGQTAAVLGMGRTSFWKLVYVEKALKPTFMPGSTRPKFDPDLVRQLVKSRTVPVDQAAKLFDKRRK